MNILYSNNQTNTNFNITILPSIKNSEIFKNFEYWKSNIINPELMSKIADEMISKVEDEDFIGMIYDNTTQDAEIDFFLYASVSRFYREKLIDKLYILNNNINNYKFRELSSGIFYKTQAIGRKQAILFNQDKMERKHVNYSSLREYYELYINDKNFQVVDKKVKSITSQEILQSHM